MVISSGGVMLRHSHGKRINRRWRSIEVIGILGRTLAESGYEISRLGTFKDMGRNSERRLGSWGMVVFMAEIDEGITVGVPQLGVLSELIPRLCRFATS